MMYDELMKLWIDFDKYATARSVYISKKGEKAFKLYIKEIEDRVDFERHKPKKNKGILSKAGKRFKESFDDIVTIVLSDANEVYDNQYRLTAKAINKGVGSPIILSKPPKKHVDSVDSYLFGAQPDEHFLDIASKTVESVGRNLTDVMVSGTLNESLGVSAIAEFRSRVIGKAALRYKDGILAKYKRDIATLALTASNKAANDAASKVYKDNSDIIGKVQWLATLDKRTTPICMGRSGLMWTVDGKPIGHNLSIGGMPPAHYRCRSRLLPVIKPSNQIDENEFKNKMKERGFSDEEIKAAKINRQASENSTAPSNLTYNGWLKTLSKDEQIAILGERKRKIWKEKGLTTADLLDNSGNPMTLSEIENKYK